MTDDQIVAVPHGHPPTPFNAGDGLVINPALDPRHVIARLEALDSLLEVQKEIGATARRLAAAAHMVGCTPIDPSDEEQVKASIERAERLDAARRLMEPIVDLVHEIRTADHDELYEHFPVPDVLTRTRDEVLDFIKRAGRPPSEDELSEIRAGIGSSASGPGMYL